jgi:LytS/YehU family sensor histidine kinase
VLHSREARARELQLAQLEGQLARAQVQALNAQIRPHFLFNTLHTIGQMWRSGRSDEADAVLDRLGALFHRVQRCTARFEVPLGEELELVREYLAIEQARFRDRLRVSVSADDAALDSLVPPLILQPIVENAIRHGVATVSSAGLVEVRAAVRGDRLELVVHDDGPGMEVPSAQRGSGTGLRNTRDRLAQLHGDRAVLRMSSDARHGTTVTIELPRRAAERVGADAAAD